MFFIHIVQWNSCTKKNRIKETRIEFLEHHDIITTNVFFHMNDKSGRINGMHDLEHYWFAPIDILSTGLFRRPLEILSHSSFKAVLKS